MTHDPVNHPSHYTSHPSGVECLTVTRHMNFNLGNAVKYIWRAGAKGDAVEDLRKAVFYLEDEIRRISPDKVDLSALTYGAKPVDAVYPPGDADLLRQHKDAARGSTK